MAPPRPPRPRAYRPCPPPRGTHARCRRAGPLRCRARSAPPPRARPARRSRHQRRPWSPPRPCRAPLVLPPHEHSVPRAPWRATRSPWRPRRSCRRMPPVRGGLDLGGTKIQAVVCDDEHRVLGQSRRETPQEGGPGDVVEALAGALEEAAADAGVQVSKLEGVGVGSPGAVDAEAGTVAEASNLPGFGDPFPLAGALAERSGVRARLGNDVSAGVAAEFELGAAREADSLLGVFWGTGVGGGIVLDGKQWV